MRLDSGSARGRRCPRVLAGEHWLLDSCLRLPLITAGFRIQRVNPFAVSATNLHVWAEGGRYSGNRPHLEVPLIKDTPDAMIEQLRAAGGARGSHALVLQRR